MKRNLTKLMAALALLVTLAIPMGMWGQTRTNYEFNLNELYQEGTLVTAKTVITESGGTLTFTDQNENFTILLTRNSGNQPGFYTSSGYFRFYNTDTFKLSAADGITMTQITVTPNGSSFAVADMDGLNSDTKTWTGSASEVTFTGSGTNKWDKLTITYSSGGSQTTTYTVTYNANVAGIDPVVDTYAEGADVTLRAANTFTNDGYTFSEWNTQADGDGDAYEAEGTIENIQENIELYAIWTENAPSNDHWVLTNLADLTSDDVFVIVGNNGSNYAMSNNNGTSVAPSAVGVTVTGNEITSTVAATIQWNISGNATDGYTFYPNGSTTTWLYCTNTNNGVRVGTNDAKTFKMASNYLQHQGTSRYVGIYNSADWRCYTSINSNIQDQTFAFYKKVTGGVIPPSISADNVSIEYNVESGSIAYTINNGVDGGVLSAATTDSWLTLGLVNMTNSTVPFTCDANSTNAARTATVTLTYTYGRSTVSKTIIVTQTADPNAISVISDITATGSYTVQGTIVAMNSRGFIVGDGTGYVYYYEGGDNFSAELGMSDIVKLSGNVTTYNHVYQFPANSYEAANSSNYNGTPAVQILDATAIGTYSSNNHLSDYVQIEGTLVKDGNYYNIQVEGLQTDASISFPTGAQADALTALNNKTVIVKGYFAGVSGGHFSVIMESVEEVVVTVPSVTVTPNTINAPATGASGSLAITYENIPDLISFDYYFCDATGVEILDSDPNYPTWIDAEIQDENDVYSVDYEIAANTGEARTAYFKVYTTDTPDNEEAFAIVTVNQAAYVPAPAGDEFVRITNLNQLTNGSLVVIASRYDATATNYLAMKNTIGNKIEGTEFVSQTSGSNEALASTIVNDINNYYWVVNVTNDGFTFTNASGQEIGYSSSTNFATGGDHTLWDIERGTSGEALVQYYEGFVITNVYSTTTNTTRCIALRDNDGNKGFGAYAWSNQNGDTYNFYLDFFVQVAPETHYLDIIGYESTNNDPVDWHLITPPVNVDPATTGMTDEVYDLYYFDEGASDGMEWINYRDANFDLVPGKGYLYAHDEDVTLTFTGTPYMGTPITLQKTENANWSGWNLVGNPYGETTAYITDGRDFYVMKADGSEIIESEINGILPMQGIFVIAAEDGEQLTFTTTAPTTTGEKLVVNVSDTRHSVIDRAMVRFGEGRTLPKFMFNGDHTKLYIAQGNEEFAVVRSINENSTPVSFRAAVNGTYTLSVTAEEVEMEYLHLIDNLTGADVDLLATPSYTFEANTTDIAQRFTLVYATVDGISENTANGFAFFNGTNWTVSNEGDATLQVVDVMGRILSTQNVNGNATITLDQPTGVYMLRLVNGDNVKVQKVVVR